MCTSKGMSIFMRPPEWQSDLLPGVGVAICEDHPDEHNGHQLDGDSSEAGVQLILQVEGPAAALHMHMVDCCGLCLHLHMQLAVSKHS